MQLRTLVFCEEGRGHAQFTRAPRTSNPMDEVLRHCRQIVVDDVGDVLDMNAAGSQIGPAGVVCWAAGR